MSEWIDAQARYLKNAERRARAKGVSVTEYLETRTTLLADGQPMPKPPPKPEPVPAINRMEDRAREASRPLEIKPVELPISDAVISFVVAEPKGIFRFDLTIPNIGEIFVDSLRNETGYRQAFIEAILYKFFGHIG